MKNKIWSTDFHLDIFNVNHHGNANAYSFFNFMQESALKHAEHLGFGSNDLLERNLLWVVTRFELHFFKEIKWDDVVRVKTWSRGLVGPFAFRDFIIESLNGECVARASSSWIPIDVVKRKSVILSKDEFHSETIHAEDVGIDPRKILIHFSSDQKINEFKVRNSDLDINKHVNNTKYIQWIYDSIPLSDLDTLPQNGFAINYINESKITDHIIILKNKYFFQAVNQDGKTIFRAEFF